MYSCQLYENCMTTLVTNITEQLKIQKFNGDDSPKALFASLSRVTEQIKLDSQLLETIKKETELIANTSFYVNVAVSVVTGRVEKMKRLGLELGDRVQMMTLLMMTDVWQVNCVLYYLSFVSYC